MPADPPGATPGELAPLFEPLQIGRITVPNRIVMAPMTREQSPGGIVTRAVADYYRRRAEGGAGLILTEGTPVSLQGSPSPRVPNFYEAAALAAWRPVVEAVHAAGGRIMPQLWHVGLLRGAPPMEGDGLLEPLGPSPAYPDLQVGDGLSRPYSQGRAMTPGDIERTIEDFATAAQNAERLGFDGVELHGAHGYLFDQFFWEATNRRDDRYNGDIAARTTFAVETIREVRRRVSPGFPVGLRFSQWKLPNNYDVRCFTSPDDLARFLDPLVAAGVDFFDCSTRRYWQPEFPGSPLSLAGWTRKISGKVTMAVGSVGLSGPLMAGRTEAENVGCDNDLDPLLAMLRRGEVDLVGVGRAHIANPDWADKVRSGRTDQLAAFQPDMLARLD